MRKRGLILFMVIISCLFGYSQENDFGVWTSLRLNKRITPKFSCAAEGELRLREDTREVDCWSGYGEFTYGLLPFLKTGGGYTIIAYNKNKIGFLAKHRYNIFVTGTYTFRSFSIALRERMQWTCTKGSDPKTSLRSRIQLSCNPKSCKISVYGTVESYHTVFAADCGLEKIRYTIGVNYKCTPISSFGLYYRFIDDYPALPMHEHILGVGYTLNL